MVHHVIIEDENMDETFKKSVPDMEETMQQLLDTDQIGMWSRY